MLILVIRIKAENIMVRFNFIIILVLMYDEYGNVHYCVDKTLRDRLEAKLLKTILEFKIVR